MADFLIERHARTAILRPVTAAAIDWVRQHLGPDALAWGKGIPIHPQDIDRVLAAIAEHQLGVDAWT